MTQLNYELAGCGLASCPARKSSSSRVKKHEKVVLHVPLFRPLVMPRSPRTAYLSCISTVILKACVIRYTSGLLNTAELISVISFWHPPHLLHLAHLGHFGVDSSLAVRYFGLRHGVPDGGLKGE